ncbi:MULTISPECIES: hypothetical protein [unclassified Nocardiopsis]|uniref:hypothetical protein n=1 Tax=unclassified Nocardiopsis TaxID=2649073 RepID=UPI00135771A0|nr:MULTISPECIES: hypothetical protein [unclassified Nocardiopsis]
MSRYHLQRPVGDDGAPILGPDGRPIIIPHFQVPSWVLFNRQVDSRALGAYAFLCSFLDASEGEVSSSVTAADIAARFGVTEQAVTRKGGRKNNPPGLVPRLAQTHALIVGPSVEKLRDCPACHTEAAVACPPGCTETRGRRRIKPRFQLAPVPPQGFLYEGPIDRWEYHKPKRIATRLREEGPDSTVPEAERRKQMPYAQVLAWPALDPAMDLLHLGVYVFIAAHTNLADARVSTGEWLFRDTIADRFGMTTSRVSQITRDLEEGRYIAKHGLVHHKGRRYGISREPTAYALRVMPPAGLMYPKPLRISEWRDPARITSRQEAVRQDPTVSLQFPHTPSDLGDVDNPGYPQAGECGDCKLGMCGLHAVDVEIADLNTHPLTHPQTHPSPSAPPPEPQGGAPAPRGGARADGDKGPGAGSGQRPGAPAAAPAAPDPALLELVRRHIPKATCLRGARDQELVVARMQELLRRGFTRAQIESVFHQVTPEQVLRPYAVVMDRMRSVRRFTEHLQTVARLREQAAQAARPEQTVPKRCGVHGTEYVPELSTPGKPVCLVCEREDRAQAPVAPAPADGQERAHLEQEDPDLELRARFLESLDSTRAPQETEPPTGGGPSLESVLEEVLPAPEPPYCGRCQQDDRTTLVLVRQAGDEVVFDRVPCGTCHPSMAKTG